MDAWGSCCLRWVRTHKVKFSVPKETCSAILDISGKEVILTLVSNPVPRTPLNYTVDVENVSKCLPEGRRKEFSEQ